MTPLEAAGTRRRALHDLLGGACTVVAGGALFLSTNAAERATLALLHWEGLQLDDLLLTLGLALIVAGWFALRRWRDSSRQLEALQQAANERAWYSRQLEELSSELLRAEDRDHHRLAEILHDEVGQTLYACQLKLDLAASEAREPAVQALVSEAKALAASALTHARELSLQLSPPALQDLGLQPALETLLATLEQRYRTPMRVIAGPAWRTVPEALSTSLCRSIQELAVNAAKHARASSVTVSAAVDDSGALRVTVSDDGRGFARSAPGARGFGLFSIERRMACVNGTLEIASTSDHGTVATLRFPAGGVSTLGQSVA